MGSSRFRHAPATRGWYEAARKQAGSRALIAALIALAASFPAPAATIETLDRLASAQVVGNVPFDDQVKTVSALGIHRARLGLRWSEVEKARGRYDWSLADRKLGEMARLGIVPIVTLFGGNKLYRTDALDGAGPPSGGEALAGFARFAAATAARYGTSQRTAPILFEIWNEPNTKTFWGRPPDPEAYARMAATTCAAIKAAAPQARVLALAMEGTPVKARYFVLSYMIDIYRQWAARAATPQLMRCADGFSMHPYLPSPEQVLRAEPDLRAFVAAHWAKPVPPLIVFSEWGYAIDQKRGRSAADQAALDVRALLIGAGLKRVTNLYQSVNTGRDPAKADQMFGLVTQQGRLKPAGDAIRRLMRAIGGYAIDGVTTLGEGAGEPVYRFAARNGRARALVLWTESGPASARVPATAVAVNLVSGAGRPVAAGALAIGPVPTLVTWNE